MNLDDIARIAGVSRTTVSRVINDHPDVSIRTRQKVLKVIEEHRFHPNAVARMLVTQQTRIIGVGFHNPTYLFPSYYASTLYQGINRVAYERNYATLMWWEQSHMEKDYFTQRILQQRRLMDGVLIATAEMDTPLIERIMETKIPFVMMEKPTRHTDEISYVTIDNIQSALMAVEHLIKLGRKHIAHITGSMNIIDGQERLEGYQKALQHHDIPFDPDLIAEGAFTRESGYHAMKELLERNIPIDAVFVGNDDSAEGVFQALKEVNLCIPDDIAVVGFDDVPAARDASPALTSIHQSIQERGAQATALLLDLIEGSVKKPHHITLPTRLVIRQSCGTGT